MRTWRLLLVLRWSFRIFSRFSISFDVITVYFRVIVVIWTSILVHRFLNFLHVFGIFGDGHLFACADSFGALQESLVLS